MRSLLFLLLVCVALPMCKGGDKASKADKNKKEVELLLQIRKAADISTVCQAHTDISLKSIKVLSSRMGTWLVTIMSANEETTEGIIKKLKSDIDIINVQLNHKEVEQRDE